MQYSYSFNAWMMEKNNTDFSFGPYINKLNFKICLEKNR